MIRVTPKSQQAELCLVTLWVVWGQSPEVLSEMAPVSAFLVPGITWASGRRWSGARRAPWGSWTRQRPRSPRRSCPWRPMTDGLQGAVPPGDAHPASLTFLPFIFGGNLHLLTGMQTSSRRTTKWTRPAEGSLPHPRRWSARPGDALPRDAWWLVTWPFLMGC